MTEDVKSVNDNELEELVAKAGKPLLVDVWAEWCGPCLALSQIIEEIAVSLRDRLRVVKLDADANPQAAQRYGVRGLPTLIMFRDGSKIGSKVGASPKGNIIDWIEDVLAE